MLKKTIEYVDYNGVERKEDFYFHMTEAEIAEWELSNSGGLTGVITKAAAETDTPKLMEIFKDAIKKSYGQKSLDGKRFIKNDELFEAFKQTEAYSKLFMSLAFDDKAATEFINGIMPGDLANKVAEAKKNKDNDAVLKDGQNMEATGQKSE